MNKDKERPEHAEREKGAPPPDYMPAIFGWMNMEDQAEVAKEIVDFTAQLKPGKDKQKRE